MKTRFFIGGDLAVYKIPECDMVRLHKGDVVTIISLDAPGLHGKDDPTIIAKVVGVSFKIEYCMSKVRHFWYDTETINSVQEVDVKVINVGKAR